MINAKDPLQNCATLTPPKMMIVTRPPDCGCQPKPLPAFHLVKTTIHNYLIRQLIKTK